MLAPPLHPTEEGPISERRELGAAVAAYFRGEKVVDLWGGYRTPERDALWQEDTIVNVASCTTGFSAMTLAMANARGWLDYEAPVARYWPEFAQNGKEDVTVRQILAHEAGLVLLDEDLPIERMRDLDDVARVPRGDRLPLDLDFYIVLPHDMPEERVAKQVPLSPAGALAALRHTPPDVIKKILWPWSLLRRSLMIPSGQKFNDRATREVELPAGSGIGTARAMARAYSVFADGGREVGLTEETFARITAPVAPATKDVVLGVPSCFALGFLRPGPDVEFGSSSRAFGAPGAGGSFAFADPDARLGYAYVMNRLDYHLHDDPRERSLRDAIYRGIVRRAAS